MSTNDSEIYRINTYIARTRQGGLFQAATGGGRGYKDNVDIEKRHPCDPQQKIVGVHFGECSHVSELVGLLADAVVHQMHEAIAEVVARRRVLVWRLH